MAFWNRYPYLNLTDFNMDYILKRLKELSQAKNINFDDTVSALGADNVQGAIDALKSLIVEGAKIRMVDDILAAATWASGATFTHIQTIANSTFMGLISAIKDDGYAILRTPNGDDFDYYILIETAIDNILLTHTLSFFNLKTQIVRSLIINGINDDDNVYVEVNPDVHYPIVNEFNGRDGSVSPEDGDYNAGQIIFDNSTSELPATRVQGAVDVVDAEIDAIVNVYGSKNLLKYPYSFDSGTPSGITWVANADGSVTLSGTATANVYIPLRQQADGWSLPIGDYKLTGKNTNNDVRLIVQTYNGLTYVDTLATAVNDDDYIFTPSYSGYDRLAVFIRVSNGADISTPLTIYPMIRDSRIVDKTFVPFAMTNKEITENLLKVKQITVNTNFDANGNAYIGALSTLGYPLCFVPDIGTNIPVVVVCDGNGSINLKSINSDWSLDMVGVGSVSIVGTLYTLLV